MPTNPPSEKETSQVNPPNIEYSPIIIEKWQKAFSLPGIGYDQTYTLLTDRGTGEKIAMGVGGKEHNQILFVKHLDDTIYRVDENGCPNPQFIITALQIFESNPNMLAQVMTFKDSKEGIELPEGKGTQAPPKLEETLNAEGLKPNIIPDNRAKSAPPFGQGSSRN